MPMPISLSAPPEACAGSRPIWAASSAASGDASMAIPSSKNLCPAAEPLPARAGARSTSTREVYSPARAGSKVHRQGQGASAIRVRGYATTVQRSKGRQYVTHIAALPGNPYDGHTLATVIPTMEDMIGNTIERLLVDA